jgi:hypothetical protein
LGNIAARRASIIVVVNAVRWRFLFFIDRVERRNFGHESPPFCFLIEVDDSPRKNPFASPGIFNWGSRLPSRKAFSSRRWGIISFATPQGIFQPCVTAGLIEAGALAGYRNDAVYLRTSRYVPPRWEAVRDAMPALFDLLENEPEASVRAVLGHWMFGYIHPYPDGNGRMARFLMNVMLASGGYPWTVIRVEDRNSYLAALDRASIDTNIEPFARFIAASV